MNTFDLHIIRRFITGILGLIGGLIVFFIVLHYVEYIDDFMDRGATMRDVFLIYYPNSIPEIVSLTSPLAVFLSCVYLTGKLAQQLQLAALQTSGVPLRRIIRPYLVVGLLITGTMFWFNGWIVPQTNRVKLDFEHRYTRDAPQQLDVNDIHRLNGPGNIVTVGFFDRTANIAHRVSLLRYEGQNFLAERIDARVMRWDDSLSTWRLQDALIRSFDPTGREYQRNVMTMDTTLRILPRDLARTERDVETMTIRQAEEYVDELRRSGAGNLGRPLVAYYTKFTYPLANLILVLIGVPLAAVRRRGGQAVQIGLGLLTAFAYLAIMKLTEPFGYSGELSPMATATLPHLAFFGVALVMLLRARR